MIVTQRKRIPWWWAVLMALPFFSNSFVESCSGNALTFTMKKYISDPALIMFLASINIAFNFLVAPFIAWKSDRIWTRFGRRKPFILAGYAGLALSLIATPLAPNIWTLAVIIVLYQFFEDVAFTGPYNPLFYEVVPLPQRGRASAINALVTNFSGLYFNFFMIGHFDDVLNLRLNLGFLGRPGVVIAGERIIYWGAAALVLAMIGHVFWNIRETPVHTPLLGDRFSMRRYLVGVFGDRQWLVIYVLIFAQISMNQGLAQLGALLMTEQFGYSKQVMGNIGGITTTIRILLVIPLAGYIADKVDRARMFQAGLILATLHHLSYWCFVKFVAANQIPSPAAIIGFDMFGSFVNVMGNIAIGPLLFDYVPRDKMGTVFSGMSFVRGMVKLTVLNGVGLWVRAYSHIFLPPGTYDYMSGFLYTFALGALGCLASVYFISQRKKGRIIEYGRIELEDDGNS